MNEKSLLMRNEIRVISGYRALVLSKYYIITVLSLITIYLSVVRFAASSFYILITVVVFPPILKSAVKDYSKGHNNRFLTEFLLDKSFQLTALKKKYHYTRANHVINSVTYLITIFLICLWQINYSMAINLNPFLRKLPFLVLITGLTLRFLAVIIYHIKLPYDIMHNKI